ncbi:pentatricopeptide repeat-containing protein At3g56030, mitochondrial [Silene latifolia]|uniref:pentatricopeptide repeat-containing protein At3g56030, mitochondrial n=1 Tax=Silene latifolia TaxID=37657 RepID=UPI003D78A3AF
MQTFAKLMKPKHTTTLFSLIHTTALSPPQLATTPLPPSPISSTLYDDLIQEAGKSHDFRRLHDLLTRRINDGCLNTNDTFRFVTNSQSTVEMLNPLFDCLVSLPEGVPRANACNALVRRLCKVGLLNNALQVLDEMCDRRLEHTAWSFRPVLETFVRQGELQKAVAFLKTMKEFGVALDTGSFNCVLREYCYLGDVNHAVELLEMMVREEGLKGDAWTYDAMVLGACKAGKVDAAMAVMRSAIDDDVKLLNLTYEHVIRALMEDGYFEHTLKFVMVCAGRDKSFNGEMFNFLATGLIKYERFDKAKMVVEEMSKRGLVMHKKIQEFHEMDSKE